MASDSSSRRPPPHTPQARLPSGETIAARGPNTALEHGVLCRQLWLRGEAGAMRAEEPPAAWNGEASWWPSPADRRAALLSLLPDLMAWLPIGLDAERKLQVADRMPFPQRWYRDDIRDDVDRPFVDAVFVDDAAHLHLVDVAVLDGGNALRVFGGWLGALRTRGLERYWLHRGDPGSRFSAEHYKLCWLRRQAPLASICSLLDSRGDEMPDRTAAAFWHWVGRRCAAYWDGNLPYGQRTTPYSILVTDGALPPDDRLLEEAHPYGNATLACVTPFHLDGDNWLRVDVRGWTRGALAERLAPAPKRVCRMAGATDVGQQRSANQDGVLWSEQDGWAAVADGMGGHPKGDVASATALRVFADAMAQWPDADAPHRRRTVAQRLRRAAAAAHAELWKANESAGIYSRMGTTLSALRLHGNEASFVHAGDSRIYEFAPGGSFDRRPELRMLTADHGEGGGLDRALGLWERIPFDIDTVSIESNALYLLCSDGLTNMVNDGEILRLCQSHGDDLPALVQALIDAANEAGGRDNITVCVVEANERREEQT